MSLPDWFECILFQRILCINQLGLVKFQIVHMQTILILLISKLDQEFYHKKIVYLKVITIFFNLIQLISFSIPFFVEIFEA